jgi:hypothetical protein
MDNYFIPSWNDLIAPNHAFCARRSRGDGICRLRKNVKRYNGGDGHPIVIDDGFEHYGYHGGKRDQFVIFPVLAHPDL